MGWLAISLSREFSWLRDLKPKSPELAGRFFTTEPPGMPPLNYLPPKSTVSQGPLRLGFPCILFPKRSVPFWGALEFSSGLPLSASAPKLGSRDSGLFSELPLGFMIQALDKDGNLPSSKLVSLSREPATYL